MSTSWRYILLGLGSISLGMAIGMNSGKLLNTESPQSSLKLSTTLMRSDSNTEVKSRNFVVDVVQKVGSAVVRIDAMTTAENTSEDLDNPLYKRFFGQQTPSNKQKQPLERGTGSGVIMSESGQIMTNAHVVKGASQVKVTLKSGQVYIGKILGLDSITDIAVVKIEANNLPTVTIGDAATLQPGEWAIAIGNPLGLDNTVTLGIISALGRSSSQIGIPNERVKFIQTDAAINPGNSGGPLFNAQGEVIGINTAIRADAQGLGFAVPIDTAQRIAQQIITQGYAKHPYLGIQMVSLSPEILEQFKKQYPNYSKLEAKQGVLIIKVLEKSPASESGLQTGDIIQKIDQNIINTASEVQDQVESKPVGTKLSIELLRQGQTKTVEVRTAALAP